MSTDVAIGTTYSLDLVTATAALMALDGSALDEAAISQIEALRAIDRLEGRVALFAQGNRLKVSSAANRRLFALLDGFVRDVRPKPRASFHPKVWVARYCDHEGRASYRLMVGSRNLTASSAWDYGVVLDGSLNGNRDVPHARLPGLAAFVEHVCEQGGHPELSARLSEIDDVCWEKPRRVDKMAFEFFGLDIEQSLGEQRAVRLRRLERLLLVSPFLDAAAVGAFSSAYGYGEANVQLVAGADDLAKVARRESEALESLNPHAMVPAAADRSTLRDLDGEADNEQGVSEDESDEAADVYRPLHAKVLAGRYHSGRCVVMVGSSNLTRRGWGGGNCEAQLWLEGEGVDEELWTWAAQHAREFDVSDLPHDLEEQSLAERLEELRDLVSEHRFFLDDDRGGRLHSEPPLPWAELDGCSLHVVRLSQADESSVAWPPDTEAVELGPCPSSDRTEFLRFRLTLRTLELSWVERCHLAQPIDTARTRSAIVHILGMHGFLRFLQASLSGTASGGDLERDPGDRRDPASGGKNQILLSLEQILRGIARDTQSFARWDHIMRRYQSALRDVSKVEEQQAEAEAILAAWQTIAEGWRA